MTVTPLPLSGLTGAKAAHAVGGMLDHRAGPPRLERVLVVDDTAALIEHEPLYQRIVSANRVQRLLCVAVGPRDDRDGKLQLPQSLAGTQGCGVLWVGDPAGIDWRITLVPVANGHPGDASGLEQLLDLLTVEEVFDRVHKAYEEREVRGKVASPGLRLAGTDDESAALAVAVRRLCAVSPGPGGPFPALLPDAAGGAVIIGDRPVARYRGEVDAAADGVSQALAGRAGARGLLRRGDGGVRGYLVELGAALTDLRDLVTRLLREADTAGELTGDQRQRLQASGIGFAAAAPVAGPDPAVGAPHPGALRTIAAAIRGGDTLPLVGGRLVATGRRARRQGSASYLPEVEQACPAALLEHLAAPPPRGARRAADVAGARGALGVNAAVQSAQALADLLVLVANREWSPYAPDGAELERARIVLDGIRAALTDRTGSAPDLSGTRGARLARMADSLLPVLCQLVVRVVADEAAAPGADERETYLTAYDRTVTLHAEWVRKVGAGGMTAAPSFAGPGLVSVSLEDDVAAIREALRYPPAEEMWQLCAPGDLGALDETVPPPVIRFASRLAKGALAGTLGCGEIEWTTSGACAGLLRLVPLRAGVTAPALAARRRP